MSFGTGGAVILGLAAALALACSGPDGESAAQRAGLAYTPRLAGISLRGFAVRPLVPGELGADTSLPIYHRFHHRCSGCHVAPSPRQAPAEAWPRIVERMGQNIEAAGLIPLAEEDAEAITQLMQRNASKPGDPPPARPGTGDRR
jgi:hypothetical protein